MMKLNWILIGIIAVLFVASIFLAPLFDTWIYRDVIPTVKLLPDNVQQAFYFWHSAEEVALFVAGALIGFLSGRFRLIG